MTFTDPKLYPCGVDLTPDVRATMLLGSGIDRFSAETLATIPETPDANTCGSCGARHGAEHRASYCSTNPARDSLLMACSEVLDAPAPISHTDPIAQTHASMPGSDRASRFFSIYGGPDANAQADARDAEATTKLRRETMAAAERAAFSAPALITGTGKLL